MADPSSQIIEGETEYGGQVFNTESLAEILKNNRWWDCSIKSLTHLDLKSITCRLTTQQHYLF